MIYTIESELGVEQVEAESDFTAAGKWAARHAGFNTESPSYETFVFHVNGVEFGAELVKHRDGKGVVRVGNDTEDRLFDEQGMAAD